MANKIPHPRNRLTETIEALYDGQPDIDAAPAVIAGRVIEECDQKLARYRQALEAGTDPALVAAWTAVRFRPPCPSWDSAGQAGRDSQMVV